MISIDDCIGFSGLSADQVDFIAHRMHMHPVIASEWIETILEQPGGKGCMTCLLAENRPCCSITATGQFFCQCLRVLQNKEASS